MNEVWQQILVSLGGSTVVLVALFGWLGKRYLDRSLERERNEYACALEHQKAQATKELEQIKGQFQCEIEAFRAAAGKGVAGHTSLWVALEKLVDNCCAFANRYVEKSLPLDEETLHACQVSYDHAYGTLQQAAILVGRDITDAAQMLLGKCNDEIKTFEACLYVKGVRSGRLTDSEGVDDYDFGEAWKVTRADLRSLRKNWHDLRQLFWERSTPEGTSY